MHEMFEGQPLSPEQQAALDAGLPAPLLRIALRGALDEDRLRQALLSLVERHDSLRLALRPSPLYRGLRQQPVAAHLDWLSLDLSTAPEGLASMLTALSQQPFDLAAGTPLRARLLRLGETEWQLCLSLAPVAGDGRSLAALFRELQTAYANPADLPEDVFQYPQFVDWRADLAEDENADAGRAYWAGLEQETLPPLRLAYRQAASVTTPAPCLSRPLPAALAPALDELASGRQQTLTTLLQAAWWALLARVSGQEAFAGGWQHDCRLDYDALAEGLGRYDKVLPLPLRPDRSRSFAEWLQALSMQLENHVGWQEHAPLQGALPSVGFTVTDLPAGSNLGLQWEVLDLPGADDRFELALELRRQADGQLHCRLHSGGGRYDASALTLLLAQYLGLLAQLPRHIDRPLAELDLNTPEQHPPQLSLCGPERDFSQDRGPASLPARLAHWAATTPEAPALEARGLTLNYGELQARVERYAAALQTCGIGPESRVALLLPRSGELLLALLAVLRAGGAYLPLDPAWPVARQRRILADAQPTLLLALDPTAPTELADQPWLSLTALGNDAGQTALAPVESVHLNHAAYVLYTSGSTGEPKGVVIEHGQLRNYTAAVSEALELGACRRFALTSSVAADLGNTTLFGAFWNGACLVVADDEDSRDGAAFARFMREQRIDCLKIVPSHLAALLEDDAATLPATLVLGGEATPRALVERIRALAPDCRLHNHYGPTETTVGLLVHSLPTGQACTGDTLPLDRALANNQAYVLEANGNGLRLAPVGVAGELYLGGAQLCRGYLNRDSDAFIDNPLQPGQRLYRSGDRARLLPDGRLQLLGRSDQQLKIRGFRVEPGVLETELLAQDGVRQAAVKAMGQQLIAYAVSTRSREDLLAALRQQLPDYLQPAQLLLLPTLPRLANGKIDRQALPDPAGVAADAVPQAPRDALEALLAELYAELLERDGVGISDSLFDLGGHSLMVIKLCARLRKLLQLEIAPGVVFDHPSVAALAQALREREPTPGRLLQIAELRARLAAMTPEERAALQAKARAADTAL